MIAHEALSAVDDGTIDNLWGSLSIDDEGMPTQRTQLIKNGKLENFLSDRMGEIKTGHKRTGSARSQSYKFAPASRMRNTFHRARPAQIGRAHFHYGRWNLCEVHGRAARSTQAQASSILPLRRAIWSKTGKSKSL